MFTSGVRNISHASLMKVNKEDLRMSKQIDELQQHIARIDDNVPIWRNSTKGCRFNIFLEDCLHFGIIYGDVV
jgi:L-rhamnose isomerase